MTSSPIEPVIATWSDPARNFVVELRQQVHAVAEAASVGDVAESLKWGQPAWRPKRPRTGSTLRLWWGTDRPDQIDLFVDCKTDIAATVQDRFPEAFHGDWRRRLTVPLGVPLDPDALWCLTHLTMTYHLAKRAR